MSDQTPPDDTAPHAYTTATPIRFAPRGTRDSNIIMLDPRTVQQWQLDATDARLDDTASQMAAYKTRIDGLEALLEDTATKADELEGLRGELEMLVLEKQRMQKKGGWWSWKSVLFLVVLLGVVLTCYDQEEVDEMLGFASM
ncbi:hypothetical protein ACJ41O_005581 [Fusarium nematophilum]